MKSKRTTRLPPPEVCPVCHEDVPRSALACPECGADHNSGWREDADSYQIAAPEDDGSITTVLCEKSSDHR